jgi:hypothetical protein
VVGSCRVVPSAAGEAMMIGDLVKVNIPSGATGINRSYKYGEIGIIVGHASDRYNRSAGLWNVMFQDTCEDFSASLLKRVDDSP